MVRFTAIALSVWAAHVATAKEQSVRKVEVTDNTSRTLFSQIGKYTPKSKITDDNALDLDQKYMEIELAKETNTGYLNAQAIYEEGGNSKSYADITLDAPLGFGIAKGTIVEGPTISGDLRAKGKVYRNVDSGLRKVKILYDTSEDQANWVMCRVGALKAGAGLEMSGCLLNTGTVTIGGNNYSYTYDPNTDNKNARTLKGLSDGIRSKMIECSPGCPFEDAQMFNEYYGTPDYADEWIRAAFMKGVTNYKSNGNGVADFSIWSGQDDALREVIKKGTVTMNVFMNVIRKFEESIVHCKSECNSDSCKNDAVETWDEGVAFYVGSLEGSDGVATGRFLHQLADRRCPNFKTCGLNGGLIGPETSYINHKLLRLFESGQNQVLEGQCGAAKTSLKSITKHMYIPIIQGSLRYAYKVDREFGSFKERAEGAVFTAAVLPRVHAINPIAARVIYDNMKVGTQKPSFNDVKAAYESVYSGMGISCVKIGGLVTSEANYKPDARPCTDSDDGDADDDDKKTADDDDKKTSDDDDKATTDDDDKKTSDDDDSGASSKSLIVSAIATVAVIFLSV